METASVSSRGVDVAEREAQRAKEGANRLEAEVKRLSTSLADLNTSYRSSTFAAMSAVTSHLLPPFDTAQMPPNSIMDTAVTLL